MSMKKTSLILLILSVNIMTDQVTAQTTPEFNEYIEKRMAVERIPGISIALIHKDGSISYQNYGTMGLNSTEPVSKYTIYESGSITKTFSAGLLRILTDQYNISPETPLREIFGDDVHIPAKNGIEITLEHLVTHTSGLPRLPGNLNPADMNDPYNEYTPEMLFDFLAGYELPRTPGEEFEYSNYAYMLFGQALQEISGKSYDQLLDEWYFSQLDMPSTSRFLSDSLRLAQPTTSGLPAQRWHSEHVPGFGGLLSTTHDLANYVKLYLGHSDHPKADLLRKNIEPLNNLGGAFNMSYAWIVATAFEDTVAFHGGGTGGFRTFAGFSPVSGRGAVVMSNGTNDVQDIGRHLINENFSLAAVIDVVEMTPEQLQMFTGEFISETLPQMTISVNGDLLMAELAGQSALPVMPIEKTVFYNDRVEARLEFNIDEGEVTGFVLKQGAGEHAFLKKQ
jgi:serine-type D-Ala-D-Ala carboxypeptidase/endopeptidase